MNYNNTFSISLDIGKVRDIKGYQSSPARSFHPDPGFLLFVPSFSFLFWSFMSPFLSLSLLGSFPSLSNIVFSCSSQFCCLCCYLFLVNSSFSLFLLKSWYFLDLLLVYSPLYFTGGPLSWMFLMCLINLFVALSQQKA